jgi:hypothetical protein
VICICNDRYSKKLETITGTLALDIPFQAPEPADVGRRLSAICKSEGITLNRAQYFAILGKAGGDLRSAINSLHLWADGVASASAKDIATCDPSAATSHLLKRDTPFESRMDDFFVDYDLIPAYIHDQLNYTGDLNQWQIALDSMASGDEIIRAIHETNQWDLLPVYAVCPAILPAASVPQTPNTKAARNYRPFPSDFGKLSRMNKHYRCLGMIAARSSRACLVPRHSFRDCTADFLVMKIYGMLEKGLEDDVVKYVGSLELTKEDIVDLREIADFGMKSFPDPKVLTGSFTRKFNASHSQSQKDSDSIEQRADYFITKMANKKAKKKGS